jgi:DNA-3-methyladenine glycosylase I
VPTRCPWKTKDPLLLRYHDEEWGVPVHDDRLLFEYLVLGGTQAGLSWSTVLKKREAYRIAFDGFDPRRVARYGEAKMEWLLANPGLIRNRNKLQSAVENARAVLAVEEEFGSLDRYLWGFVGGRPIQNAWPRRGTRSRRGGGSTMKCDRIPAWGIGLQWSTSQSC